MAALSLANFFDLLTIRDMEFFEPTQSSNISRGMEGKVLETMRGFAIWRARIRLVPMYHREFRTNAAVLSKVRPGVSFMAYDRRVRFPASAPGGTALVGFTPLVSSINVDNRRLAVKALPATFVVTTGDHLSIALDDGSFSLHRVIAGATAVAGVTPQFEVYPHLPQGIAVDDPVTLVKASGEFIITPGTHVPGSASGTLTDGDTLDIEEYI